MYSQSRPKIGSMYRASVETLSMDIIRYNHILIGIILLQWLDSDLIQRLSECFELKIFMVILLIVKNDAYSRILSVKACSRAEIL